MPETERETRPSPTSVRLKEPHRGKLKALTNKFISENDVLTLAFEELCEQLEAGGRLAIIDDKLVLVRPDSISRDDAEKAERQGEAAGIAASAAKSSESRSRRRP